MEGIVDIDGTASCLLYHVHDEKRGAFDTGHTLSMRCLNNGGNFLGDGIERSEVEDLVFGNLGTSDGVFLQGFDESFVDGVNAIGFSRCSQTGCDHEIVVTHTFYCIWCVEGQLVFGQGTGFCKRGLAQAVHGEPSGTYLSEQRISTPASDSIADNF